MEKNVVLEQVSSLAAQHLITEGELAAAYNKGAGQPSPSEILPTPSSTGHGLSKHLSINDILYYIGGAIVFTGIAVMIGTSWTSLSSLTRVLVTFGFGIVTYITGLIFGREERTDGVSQAFYLISALVLPIGLYVILDVAGVDLYTAATATLISSILVIVFGLSAFLFRKTIFLIFSIIFGTWLFFAVTDLLVGGNPIFDGNFYLYRVLCVGLTYMFLGYHFLATEHRDGLSGWLYGFGSLGFLGSALALGGWTPSQNSFWELIYPGLVFGVLFLSVVVKSKAFLVWGSIFLMGYILKITAEYFTEGLGWPLALVLAGLALIGVGYASSYLNRKYISTTMTN